MKQLLNGLHYLSLKKILHRDIKSANILVTRNNVIKIADWGLARSYMDTTRQDFTNPVVTLWYRSPELLYGCKRYGSEVDIWSIGCVFCELKERIAPLRADNETDQIQKIFDLCGYPTAPALRATYEKYPDWEKYVSISSPAHANVVPRLRQRYNHFGENDLILLEKLLDIDPAKVSQKYYAS
jgi:serine/threonine protein kinase